MAKTVVKMSFSKDTKGTYVFASDDADSVVPTLYVKKAAFKNAPKSLTLTLDDGESAAPTKKAK